MRLSCLDLSCTSSKQHRRTSRVCHKQKPPKTESLLKMPNLRRVKDVTKTPNVRKPGTLNHPIPITKTTKTRVTSARTHPNHLAALMRHPLNFSLKKDKNTKQKSGKPSLEDRITKDTLSTYNTWIQLSRLQ